MTGRRAGALMVALLVAPLGVPASQPAVRFFAAIVALLIGAKLVDLARGRVSDPAMTATRGRRLMWFLVPPDTRWPADAAQARAVRREGRRRALRALARLPGVAALIGVAVVAPHLTGAAVVSTAWDLLFTWLWITAAVDLGAGLVMQTGVRVAEVFRAPALARSPADFWGRRWNRAFRQWAWRHLYLPLGGRRRPGRALMAVFAFSALVHEYLVVVSLGTTDGHMAAFFLVNGGATLATVYARRRWRPLPAAAAVLLHWAWLLATAPLFFTPLYAVFCLE